MPVPTEVLIETPLTDLPEDPFAMPGLIRAPARGEAESFAEPDLILLPFLIHPAPGLLKRYARQHAAHAPLIAEILGLLADETPALPPAGLPCARPQPLLEPLSKSELRVLRYLPTHLSAQEIANELYVSANTVKTHLRTLYAKLGAHSRAEAVDRARALGLLTASSHTPGGESAGLLADAGAVVTGTSSVQSAIDVALRPTPQGAYLLAHGVHRVAAVQGLRGEGASRPSSRARSTASERRCAPSLAYR